MAKASTTTPPAASVPQAVPMTTLQGFAIQMTGFIPIPKNDLRKQSEIPMLLLDIQEGRKSLASLIPYIKDLQPRQQYLSRRFEVSTVEAWAKADAEAAAKLKAEEDKQSRMDEEDKDADPGGEGD